MAEHFEITIVREAIPVTDISPLELMLLSRVFVAVCIEDAWYFHAMRAPGCFAIAKRAAWQEAIDATRDFAGTATDIVFDQMSKASGEEIEIDLMEVGWEFLLQDILRRSATLRYVSVVSVSTCSRIRGDSFGAGAWLITPDKVLVNSTEAMIKDFLQDAGIARQHGWLDYRMERADVAR